MFKKLRQNKEVIGPVILSVIFLLVLITFRSFVYDCFLKNNVNELLITISLALTGFVLTAYTVFLGFYNQISSKIKSSPVIEKVEFRFRFTIYISIILLVSSLTFIFYQNSWIPLMLLSLTFFLIELLFLLISYLKILFEDIRKNNP